MSHRGAHFGSQAVLQGVSIHSLRQKQVPRSDLPTGGRISFFLKAWEKITSDVWTLSVVRSGYRIQFRVLPRLLLSPPKWCTRMPKDPVKMEILKGEVESLLQKRAIEEVTSMHPKRGFFSRIFLVQKRTGGWRPVIDLSRLNQFVLCPHFKMETLNSIRLALQKGDWVTSLDLRDAYFHIGIHRRSRRYLRFVFEGKVYQFRALAFGLNVSPYVFTRMLKTVLRHVRRLGIRVHAYLDDWLQPSVSETLSWLHSRRLLKIILDLGFIPNWEKSELVPVQDFCFLGARFKLAQALIGPSQDNIASILQALAKLVGARQASARQLYSILGQMESMASLLPLGRAFKRSLQWELKERWCQRLALWDTNILLGQWFVSAVAPWMDLDFLTSMSPLHHPSPQLHLFTDSSLEGWGAHMDNHMASGFWSIINKKQHINVLEMKAVLLALQAFAVHIKGHSVLLATDNTTVAAYINKQGGTHSRTLCNLAVEAAEWCARNKVHLKARYLPGRLNALADCLSRKGAVVQTEWSLNQRVASQIFHVWGSPHIDLFATHLNRKLPLFVSPVLEPEAYATDALSLSWVGMWAYAFPPFPLILTCLRKIQIEECLVCLVAPLWEGQAWFPLLLSLLVAPAICLPWKEDLLYQPISRMLHPTPQVFRLHAWLLCNNACKRQAFLNQLPDESIPRKDLPPTICMITGGNLGWIGASDGKWIPSIRL